MNEINVDLSQKNYIIIKEIIKYGKPWVFVKELVAIKKKFSDVSCECAKIAAHQTFYDGRMQMMLFTLWKLQFMNVDEAHFIPELKWPQGVEKGSGGQGKFIIHA